MRLLSLIITLLIIGALVYKQLGTSSPKGEPNLENTSLDVPKVPTKPNEVPAFEKDINKFMNEKAKETARRIEDAENKK